LGLEAQGIDREERRQRALKAIDMIGLDGFESAFPKELSGGMCQRVGFARALVVNPDVLLMDEPFSALDVLTSENLRSDLLDLWSSQQSPLKSIFMVTHDIAEAAMMADRIIIFNSNPGSIRAELEVEFPHPRSETDPKVRELIDEIYSLMTSPERDIKRIAFGPYQHKTIDLGYRLPEVEVSSLTGLIEEMAFSYCTKLTDISIPGSVTNIGFGAFASCSVLTSATIADGVTNIGDYEFYDCANLISVTIPGSISSIGALAPLTSVPKATVSTQFLRESGVDTIELAMPLTAFTQALKASGRNWTMASAQIARRSELSDSLYCMLVTIETRTRTASSVKRQTRMLRATSVIVA